VAILLAIRERIPTRDADLRSLVNRLLAGGDEPAPG
jgi:hypothetical protein